MLNKIFSKEKNKSIYSLGICSYQNSLIFLNKEQDNFIIKWIIYSSLKIFLFHNRFINLETEKSNELKYLIQISLFGNKKSLLVVDI